MYAQSFLIGISPWKWNLNLLWWLWFCSCSQITINNCNRSSFRLIIVAPSLFSAHLIPPNVAIFSIASSLPPLSINLSIDGPLSLFHLLFILASWVSVFFNFSILSVALKCDVRVNPLSMNVSTPWKIEDLFYLSENATLEPQGSIYIVLM